VTDQPPPPALVEALAGRYGFERELGRGGMASVFLARDERHDRHVAVKVLRSGLAPAFGVDRFLREIRIAAKLVHPHILPVLDSGEAGGEVFFVMPYVAGESLRDRLRRESELPIGDALRIAREVADALGFAHAQGIVHRDIKPENILLEAGHAVVADFGIALALRGGGSEGLTETGIVLGTPAYMSPEQAVGSASVDGRSDVYSLACVLFEMLAGEPPFGVGAASRLIERRATVPAPSVAEARPAVPRHVDQAIATALERVPADRHGSALEFAASLSADTPARESSAPTAIAVLPFANMSPEPEDEYFSDGITEEIINAVGGLPGIRVTARTSAFQFKSRDLAVQDIARKLGVDRVLEGSVRRSGRRVRVSAQLVNAADGYQLWSERFDRDLEDVFAIQDEIAAAIATRLAHEVADGATAPRQAGSTAMARPDPVAYDAYLRGRYHRRQMFSRLDAMDRAEASYREAIEAAPSFAPAWSGLAELQVVLGIGFATRPSHGLMTEAKAAAERALSLDAGLAEAQLARALVAMYHDWDYPAARAGLDRALAINPSFVDAHFWSEFYATYVERDVDKAVAANRRASELDPLDLNVSSRLVQVLLLFDRLDEAIARGRRILAVDPDHMVTHLMLADGAMRLGDFAGAVASADRAIALSGRAVAAVGVAGTVFALAGKPERARALVDELTARAREGYVFPFWRAVVHAALGDTDLAFELLAEAKRDRDPNLLYLSATPQRIVWRSDPRFAGVLRDIGLGHLTA